MWWVIGKTSKRRGVATATARLLRSATLRLAWANLVGC